MENKEEKIVLNTSDESAKYVTNIEGWVSRNGHFYGKDERMARWDGCTHIECEDCKKPVPKHSYTVCDECRVKRDDKRYSEMVGRKYDGEVLYSDRYDKYFMDIDELEDFCEEEGIDVSKGFDIAKDLKLIICDPIYPRQIDYDDMYIDDLPEDSSLEDVAPDLADAFNKLNDAIKEYKKDGKPLCWTPGKFVPIFND